MLTSMATPQNKMLSWRKFSTHLKGKKPSLQSSVIMFPLFPDIFQMKNY